VTRHYPAPDLPQILRNSVQQANQAIATTVKEANVLKGMGCTLIGALLDSAGMHYASVGDSHLFLVRGNKLSKTNADHSYGGYLDRMAASGQPVVADPTLTRNMLLSALTGENIMEVDCPPIAVELKPGDRVLICTDGVDSLTHDEILAVSKSSASAKICAEKMLTAVKQKNVPRQDNTTVVAIDVRAEADSKAAGATSQVTTMPAEARPATDSRASKWLLLLTGLLAVGAGLWYFKGQILPRTPDRSPTGITQGTTPAPTAPAETPAGTGTEAPAAIPTPLETEPVPTFKDPLRGGGSGPALVWIPAGTFQMGSVRAGADPDEQPGHEVKLQKFAMMRHELTVAEYERFASVAVTVPANQQRDKYPMTMVSWKDATLYAQWLSAQTGKKYRLPTEAEWEYAASGGTNTPYWWGYRPEEGRAYCHACGPGLVPSKPTDVGRFPQNQFGLVDTAGNVSEWIQDCYAPSYEGASADGSAKPVEPCTQRVVRGGSFSSPPKSLRTSKRLRFNPDRGYDDIGIRLVREP
jgi:formylglycine-generating enzyme required for sulfatase activity